jgi:four helix bundle protein
VSQESGVQEFRSSGVQEFRSQEFRSQEFRSQEFRSSGVSHTIALRAERCWLRHGPLDYRKNNEHTGGKNLKNYRDLAVWEKSHSLTVSIYMHTKGFPKEELFGLTSQIRRSCVSIPTNIAEGCGRRTKKEFARFLDISAGSTSELEYLIFLSGALGYLSEIESEKLLNRVIEIRKMIAGLLKSLQRTTNL